MVYMLIVRRPCMDDYYSDYNDVVWVGTEAPSDEVMDALADEHDCEEEMSPTLRLWIGTGAVDVDDTEVVRPVYPESYMVLLDGEVVDHVMACDPGEAKAEALTIFPGTRMSDLTVKKGSAW